jgi:hypothetical protein
MEIARQNRRYCRNPSGAIAAEIIPASLTIVTTVEWLERYPGEVQRINAVPIK